MSNVDTTRLLTDLRNAVAKRTIETIDLNRDMGDYEALEFGFRNFGKCKRAISVLTNELDPTTISRVSRKRYRVKQVVSDSVHGGNIRETD